MRLYARSSGMKNALVPSGVRLEAPRRRSSLLLTWFILLYCALAQTPLPEEVVVEGEVRRDVGVVSASVTVVTVDDRLPVGADLADAVRTASGAVVRRLGGVGNHAAVSLRGSSFASG